jgi:hypothetical protein|nr:MAG TPA: hypothetical protein [Bacteriophage sp.]
MNFTTFYYLAILIAIAAKLFGYLAASWLWIIGFAVLPFFVGLFLVFVGIIMAAVFNVNLSNNRYRR